MKRVYGFIQPVALLLQKSVTEITTTIHAFLTQWTAHGASLNAGVSIPYNRFIVIALDESQQEATGCSIDASVKIIQEIEAITELLFWTR